MRRDGCWSVCSCLAAVAVGLSAARAVAGEPLAAGTLRVGQAAVTINPPLGTPLAGYYSERGCQGVLDDIHAKAVAMDDGRTQAIMVVCDLIGLPQAVVSEARRLIEEKTGVPAGQVMIAATHTHTAPVVLGDSAITDLVASNTKLSEAYTRQLPTWIAQAAAEAYAGRTPARVFFASRNETELSFIRRFWMKDGTVGWNPGKLNAKVIRPIGQVDPQVNVVYAEAIDRKPLVTLVNFALHLDTTGGYKVSADFPATLARCLGDYKGPGMLTVFANGACGNVNHVDVTSAQPQHGPEEARRIGTALAGDVLKAYLHMTAVDDVRLRVRREVVQLAPAVHTAEELRKAREIAARRGVGATFLEQVKAYRILDVEARQGKPFEVEVQVFGLGREVAWVALPGEVFTELGVSIKAASPLRQTNVVELANGGTPYIPNRSAFPEGQYEVVSTRYAEGAGELLVTTALRLLADLDTSARAER